MKVDELKALENVRVIRDYLNINAKAVNFTSLNFLNNLRTIKGQHLARK